MSTSTLPPGTVIASKYRVDQTIGFGGFSAVYRATHLSMERPVALKLLSPPAGAESSDESWVQRFEREARVISQLKHPNTITVFDHGVEDGKMYLVMEFVEGESLFDALEREGAMPAERVVTIVRQLLGSLEEAHHLGILHRDLKPANIMLERDYKGREQVKVLDFGIAKVMDQESRGDLTQENSFVGTPRYASPEQLVARPLSAASDLYAVGLLLFEMLTGKHAVPSSTVGVCLEYHLGKKPWTLPREVEIPQGLRRVVERALLKPPRQRFASCAEMLQALEGWREEDELVATLLPSPEQAKLLVDDAMLPTLDLDDERGARVDAEDEPWPQREQRQIIDPNLSAEFYPSDGPPPTPFLLGAKDSFDPSAARAPERHSSPHNSPPGQQTSRTRPLPKPQPTPELELEELGSHISVDEVDRSQAWSDRVHRAEQPQITPLRDPRGSMLPRNLIGYVIVGILLIGGVFALRSTGVLSSENSAPSTPPRLPASEDSDAIIKRAEEQLRPTPKQVRRGRFSDDGIMLVPKVAGWSPVEVKRHNMASFVSVDAVYSARGARMELSILTARSDELLAQALQLKKKRVQRVIAFDDKRVVLTPLNDKARGELDGLERGLLQYKALITKESEGDP